MKITIVGTGYVGLVTGACLADTGVDVTCVDVDQGKIDGLKDGIMPIYEPGLEEIVKKNVKEGRLNFTTSLPDSLHNSSIIFSAVGTPPDEDGSADLKYVLEVARTIGQSAQEYFVLATKSTVPVGTAEKVKRVISEELAKRGRNDLEFDIVSNPEFLCEGAAVKGFMNPARIIVGAESEQAKALIKELYKPFTLKDFPLIFMDVASAEMTKYAANAMLATRISFMNEIANLCEIVGADVDMVRKGIGSDSRIGNKFLNAGAGFGGSCFPKDVKALYNSGRQNGYRMRLIEAVEHVNESQKQKVFDKLGDAFGGDLGGKVVAMWGLSFKPQTDDMREAPSLVVIDKLIGAGATVRAFDPISMEETKRRIGDKITYCTNIYDAAQGADAVVLMTEWQEFHLPSWEEVARAMRGNVVVDGRNIYDEQVLINAGFRYLRIGKKGK